MAVLLLYTGTETTSVWKEKVSFWKPLSGRAQWSQQVGNEAREAGAGASREVPASNWESIKYLLLEPATGTVWDQCSRNHLHAVLSPHTSKTNNFYNTGQ